MIKEVKKVNFSYKGNVELDYDTKTKISKYWDELKQKSDLLHENKILVVSKIEDNDGVYDIELKDTTFSHFMYSKMLDTMDIRCMFSGTYILTCDNYVVLVLNNMYKGYTFQMVNLVGGMSDFNDIVNGKYLSEKNLKREFKEELGLIYDDSSYSINLKYIKCPSENENPVGYAIGVIYEIKTVYSKLELENMFNKSIHDNEIQELIFVSKENYKSISLYEHKKEYIPELLEKIFE